MAKKVKTKIKEKISRKNSEPTIVEIARELSLERSRLYKVLETLPVYVALLDKDYHVPFANKVFRERFGESQGKKCYEFLFHRSSPCPNCETYKVLKTNKPRRWEWTGPDKRKYDIYDFPFSENGSNLILEMGIDITERRKAEGQLSKYKNHLEELIRNRTKDLRDSEERFSKAFHQSPVPMTISHLPGGQWVDVNASFLNLVRYKRKDLMDHKSAGLKILVGGSKKRKSLINQLNKSCSVKNVEIDTKTKDGKILKLLFSAVVVNVKEERYAISTQIDITDLKKTEEVIIEKEEKYQEINKYLESLFNYANAPIITWDPKFRITRFNHAFEHLTGYKAKEVIGKKLNILFSKDNQKENMEKIKQTLIGKYWENVEIPISRKDKNIRTVLWNSANIYSEKSNNLISVIAQGIDITDRIRLEKQKDEFFNIASHELKTPLTSIKAFNQILAHRMTKSSDRQTKQILKLMDEQIDRLTNLIITMLDVSKIESGKLIYQKDDVDVDKLIQDTVRDILLSSEKKLEIKIIGKTKKIIKADCYRIGQVLSNLLINAIKYSPGSNLIIVRAKTDKKRVTISVQDFGIGIPKSKINRLFEKFGRLEEEQTDAQGFSNLGLGLYISSEIIKRHKGKIWAESVYNKGSTFYFTLPTK